MVKRSKKEVADLFLEQQKVDKYLDPVEFSTMLGYKSPSRLYRALNFYNISYVSKDRNKNQRNYNKEALYGNLLGDGFIYYSTKNSNYPVFSVEYKYLEYITYISRINPFLNGQKINSRVRTDDRFKNPEYTIYHCRSLSSSVLKTEHERWYVNSVKTVPKDLIITPLTLLIWYLDDGCLNLNKGLSLYTYGFSIEDSQFLKEQLETNFNLNCSFHYANYADEKRVCIYIKKSSLSDFFQLIGPCPVNCYQHKWQ